MNDLTEIKQLRVSVATYNRVLFQNPDDGTRMLALERQATVMEDGRVNVRAQPFGGGIHILNPTPLQKIIGKIQFDSERSKHEQDFRILIPPSKWELIKDYCLQHLQDEEDIDLEIEPDRELTEEFFDTMKVKISASQYTVQPQGFVIENNPVRSGNVYARGQLTVHLYRVYEIQIVDPMLSRIILTISQLYSDPEVGALALQDFENYGKGRFNTILAVPVEKVMESYLAMAPETRYREIVVDQHVLEESVLAILPGVDVPEYQRM
ncbi:MAG: hypothetical protein ACM3XO_21485 [Bacteroidota bacterium]